MNASSHSQWSNSSGCESGWTMYLDQSSSSTSQENHCRVYNNCKRVTKDNEVVEEEEDLSMVSDASSGRPLCCEEENYCFDLQYSAMKGIRKYNKKINQQQQRFSCLDDTASSSVSNKKFSKSVNPLENVFEFSPGSSNTRLKGKSKLKNLGVFESSNIAGKSASKAGGFLGTRQK